jgi:hypothetical protein
MGVDCRANARQEKLAFLIFTYSYFTLHKDLVSDRKVPFAETEATVVFDWEKGRNSEHFFMTRHYLTACLGRRVPTPTPLLYAREDR